MRLPVVVAADPLRGRADALLKATPAQLARMPALCIHTQRLLGRFHRLSFDAQSFAVAARLIGQAGTRKRYAAVLLAAQPSAGPYTLVTRPTEGVRALLPAPSLQNGVAHRLRGVS